MSIQSHAILHVQYTNGYVENSVNHSGYWLHHCFLVLVVGLLDCLGVVTTAILFRPAGISRSVGMIKVPKSMNDRPAEETDCTPSQDEVIVMRSRVSGRRVSPFRIV